MVTVGEAWLAFALVAVLVGVPAYLLMSAIAAPGLAIAIVAPAALGIALLAARMRVLQKAAAAVVSGL